MSARISPARSLLLLAMVAFSAQAAQAADPLDWSYWRGPEMNGISREKNLPDSWSPDGENLVWLKPELATRSTPIVMRGKLYTLARHMPHSKQECEKVICADAKTGEILWETAFNVFLSDVPDTRVAWSSVVGDPETGNVFALGVCGYFAGFDGQTGKTLWSHSLSEEYGMLTTYGGRTNFPIIHENLVIISGVTTGWGDQARPEHRILAFDKRNGQSVWVAGTRPLPEDTTYSAPILATIDGQTQLVIGAGDGAVYSLQPRTGKTLWKYNVSLRGLNTTPLLANNMIICGHSEENLDDTKMGALFAIDPTKSGDITTSGEIWRTKELFIGKTQPIVVGETIYAIDDAGTLFSVDLKTGKQLGKQKIGTMGRGSPLYADGKIYCTDATGRWSIFGVDSAGKLKKLHQIRLDAEINGSPIISHGRIYLPTDVGMYCIGKPDAEVAADPAPEPAVETPVAQDQEAATALLTPAESLLEPGQKQQYQVLLYNKNGQFLNAAPAGDVKFSVVGPGAIDAAGKYTAAGDKAAGGVVNAEVGTLKAPARLRVVTPFPWDITFTDGLVPINGIGMRYRHIAIDFDLFAALRAKDPLAAKLYIFLMTQYTNAPPPPKTDQPAGPPVAKFDNTTPAQTWTGFKTYLGLLEAITDQDQAKEKLDPSLKLLQDEGVIARWEWTGTPEIGAQLQATKGPRKIDGNGVMCKITTIPKGTRSQGWLGFPASKNYTIQADTYAVKGEANEADPNSALPDAGIINQRYRLDLMGASQQLKLYSWYPHDQKFFDLPFAWTPDTWYTMKLEVTNEMRDGEEWSVCRGKVWKRDEAEPEAWSIEWADRPANDTGSPGLSGNVKNSELFFDNVKVTPRTN